MQQSINARNDATCIESVPTLARIPSPWIGRGRRFGLVRDISEIMRFGSIQLIEDRSISTSSLVVLLRPAPFLPRRGEDTFERVDDQIGRQRRRAKWRAVCAECATSGGARLENNRGGVRHDVDTTHLLYQPPPTGSSPVSSRRFDAYQRPTTTCRRRDGGRMESGMIALGALGRNYLRPKGRSRLGRRSPVGG